MESPSSVNLLMFHFNNAGICCKRPITWTKHLYLDVFKHALKPFHSHQHNYKIMECMKIGPPQEYILVAERRPSHAAGHETNQVLQVGGWLRVNSPYRKITIVTETQTDIRNNIQVLGGGGASSKEDRMKPSSESRKEAGQRKSPSSAKCLRSGSWKTHWSQSGELIT